MDHGASTVEALVLSFNRDKLLRFFGSVLGVAGVVFVLSRLIHHFDEINFSSYGAGFWFIVCFLSVLYGAANVTLARAWWSQLIIFGVNAEWSWALRVYGLSQLAKYVPGNIFHLAGRQALSMADGLPARPVAKSVFWELGSIAFAGACVGLLALPLVSEVVAVRTAVAFYFLTFCAAAALLRYWGGLAAAVGFVWQTIFLFCSGGIFLAILALLDSGVPLNLATMAPPICGAYVLAWLAGLVTPGAPAGLGIREAILLFSLGGAFSPDVLLLAIVIGRIVSVVGDLCFFGIMASRVGRD